MFLTGCIFFPFFFSSQNFKRGGALAPPMDAPPLVVRSEHSDHLNRLILSLPVVSLFFFHPSSLIGPGSRARRSAPSWWRCSLRRIEYRIYTFIGGAGAVTVRGGGGASGARRGAAASPELARHGEGERREDGRSSAEPAQREGSISFIKFIH